MLIQYILNYNYIIRTKKLMLIGVFSAVKAHVRIADS